MVINVNYGLGQYSACPLPMQQLAEAVNWVAANAEKYGFDTNRFAVTGDSAGAYYACFLAVLQDSPYLQQLFDCHVDIRITSAVFNCGVYDMKKALSTSTPLKSSICREFTGMNLKEAQQSEYFPGLTLTDFVTEKFPPSMIIYAQKDILCHGQGELLSHKLRQCHVPTECVCATSVIDNHCYSLLGITTMAKETNRLMLNFFRDNFYSKHTK